MLLVEQFLVILSPYPGLQHVYYFEYNDLWNVWIRYSINDILLCLVFIRVYLLVRFTLLVSDFMTPRSKRICTMNGCDANLMFASKSILKRRPYTTVMITLGVTIFVFGYQLKVLEGPISGPSGQDFT